VEGGRRGAGRAPSADERAGGRALLLFPADPLGDGLIFPRDKAEPATAHDPWKLLAKPLQVVADWLPFFLFLSIYLMFRGEPMQKLQGDNCDALLAAWEEMIFRGHASLWLEKYASIWLTLTMQYFYSLHIWFTTPAAAILCYMKDRKLLRELMLAMTVVAGLGAVGYINAAGRGAGSLSATTATRGTCRSPAWGRRSITRSRPRVRRRRLPLAARGHLLGLPDRGAPHLEALVLDPAPLHPRQLGLHHLPALPLCHRDVAGIALASSPAGPRTA
jgi:hypothetical protein